MSVAPQPHPDLGRLAELLGSWSGEGHGSIDGGPEFRYREELTFGHNGKPFLSYLQRTRAVDDGRPLHTEAGYWRAADGQVEVVLAHAIGVVEVELGRWEGDRLQLRNQTIQLTPAAKQVTALERDFELAGDELRYELRMSRDGGAARWHLAAQLHRAAL
jgi:hypothetical protein